MSLIRNTRLIGRLVAGLIRLSRSLNPGMVVLAGALLMPIVVQATPAAIVVDVGTGAILSASNIDAPQPPDLTGRLLVVTMAIQDVADGTLRADEELELVGGDRIFAASAIRMTAEGGPAQRVPTTLLVGRIGHNPKLLQERMFALSRRIGMRGSNLEIHRGPDGGPRYGGSTTIRDTARLMTSLLRAHGDATRTIFERTVTGLPGGEVWMIDGSTCLLTRHSEGAGRRMLAAVGGSADAASCRKQALELLDNAASRLMTIALGGEGREQIASE